MVCCESFKFHERVQLDSITHNELGDPDALATVPECPGLKALAGWQVRAWTGPWLPMNDQQLIEASR